MLLGELLELDLPGLVAGYPGTSQLSAINHLTAYSYRTTRAHNHALLRALVPRQRQLGLIEGNSFNLDRHAELGRLSRSS